MVIDFHHDPGDFVCLFYKCFNFGENVILGLGSGKFYVKGGKGSKEKPFRKACRCMRVCTERGGNQLWLTQRLLGEH